jgi:hypothetical protein
MAVTGPTFRAAPTVHYMETDSYCTTHRQFRLVVGDYADEVDEGLVPILRPTWLAGIETVSSCQNDGERLNGLLDEHPHLGSLVVSKWGRVSIDFHPPGIQAFLNLVAWGDPGTRMYERMTHWLAPGAWKSSLILLALQPGDFQFYGANLSFPVSDIPEVAACLEQATARAFDRPPSPVPHKKQGTRGPRSPG